MIASDVVSVPWKTCDVEADDELLERVRAYFDRSLDWLRDDVQARGGQVILAVQHWDEDHPHMHVISLPGSGTAATLHPGEMAQREAIAEARRMGEEEAVGREKGRDAYRGAMNVLLDAFHAAVGCKFGLARRGTVPTRRVSWAERRIEKQEEQIAALEARSAELEARVRRGNALLAERRSAYREGQIALRAQKAQTILARDAMHDADRARDVAEIARDDARREECEALAAAAAARAAQRDADERTATALFLADAREAELEARERDVATREEALARREADVARRTASIADEHGRLERVASKLSRQRVQIRRDVTSALTAFGQNFDLAVSNSLRIAGIESDDPVAIGLGTLVRTHDKLLFDLSRTLETNDRPPVIHRIRKMDLSNVMTALVERDAPECSTSWLPR